MKRSTAPLTSRREARAYSRSAAETSGYHAAFEHLVQNRRRNLIDKVLSRLGVVAQEIDGHLLFFRRRVALHRLQLFATRRLVFLHHFIGRGIQEHALGRRAASDEYG